MRIRQRTQRGYSPQRATRVLANDFERTATARTKSGSHVARRQMAMAGVEHMSSKAEQFLVDPQLIFFTRSAHRRH